MIALIRSDAYRVAHSRWIWALAAIVAVLVVAPPLAMRWAGGWPASYADLTGDALAMGGVQMLAAGAAASHGSPGSAPSRCCSPPP